MLLLGACLGSQQVLESCKAKIDELDPPSEFQPLWAALRSGVGSAVRAEAARFAKIEDHERVIDALLRNVLEAILEDFVSKAKGQIEMAKIVTPDQFTEMVEGLLTRIRVRQTRLQK